MMVVNCFRVSSRNRSSKDMIISDLYVMISCDSGFKCNVYLDFCIRRSRCCMWLKVGCQFTGRKVGEGYVCLWCNERGRAFHNTQAVQKHMVDKGHCKMLHEGDAIFEYVDFYDYRYGHINLTTEEQGRKL